MSPLELFKTINGNGDYLVSYLCDGWTRQIKITASSARQAMVLVQREIGDIVNVVAGERER